MFLDTQLALQSPIQSTLLAHMQPPGTPMLLSPQLGSFVSHLQTQGSLLLRSFRTSHKRYHRICSGRAGMKLTSHAI